MQPQFPAKIVLNFQPVEEGKGWEREKEEEKWLQMANLEEPKKSKKVLHY